LPLQLTTALGLVSAGLGLSFGAYYLVRAFLGLITVPGYASIISSVFFLGGVQLLALGVIGEYIGRLHLNVNKKPQYREREALARHDEGSDVERPSRVPGERAP
jgi:hypothetical protein